MFYGHRFIKISNEYLFDLTEGIGYRTEVNENGEVKNYESVFKFSGYNTEPEYILNSNGIVPAEAKEAAETSKKIINNYQKMSLLV